jgi:hypothetical protein
MDKESGIAWNKVWGAVVAPVIGPVGLLLFEPPRSYLLACAALCFGWYEAFGLLPNLRHNATMSDVYRAFRAMPARNEGLSSRLVGLLGLVLVITAILVRS